MAFLSDKGVPLTDPQKNAIKADLNLDQVSNVPDADKPISTATQAALNTKQPLIPDDVYDNDVDAYAGGIELGEIYRKTGGSLAWRGQLQIGKVAFVGDSQTAFGAAGLTGISGQCYWCWLRALSGSKLDIEPDTANGSLVFATGGFQTSQMLNHAQNAAASDADFVFVMGGTNDVIAGIPASTTVSNIVNNLCAAIKNGGKAPIVVAVLPIPLGAEDNADGSLSAKVVEINDLLEIECAQAGVKFYNLNSVIEESPGIPVIENMDNPADFHLSPLGASRLGRALHEAILQDFAFNYDPFANENAITANADFANTSSAAGHVYPTGYQTFSNSPDSVGLNSVYFDVETGLQFWRVPLVDGGPGGSVQLFNYQANTESPAGLQVDGICVLKVNSGIVRINAFNVVTNTSAVIAKDLSDSQPIKGEIKPEDGLVIVRSPVVTVAGGVTRVSMDLYVSPVGDATLDVSFMTIRKY